MSAHLRAFERFQGAARLGDREASRVRIDEALKYAASANEALAAASGSMLRLSAALSGIDASQQIFVPTARDPSGLPSEVLAILYISGLPVNALERVLRAQGSFSMQTTLLDRAAFAAGEMAAQLAGWTPPTIGAP
jgi:hypothetical protein